MSYKYQCHCFGDNTIYCGDKAIVMMEGAQGDNSLFRRELFILTPSTFQQHSWMLNSVTNIDQLGDLTRNQETIPHTT
jgi:hypothetical protein